MQRPHRKLVIITIPCLAGWGTEQQTLMLSKALRELGWNVSICCYYEYDEATLHAFRDIGSELILLNMDRKQGILNLIIRLRKVFRQKKPDIVHVQYMIRGLSAIISSRLAGVPRIYATVHHSGRIYGWRQKSMLRLASVLTTRFFCNSRAVEESWFGRSSLFDGSGTDYHKKHVTFYNAVCVNEDPAEEALLCTEIRTMHGLEGKRIVGMVGRFSREKGHETIIDAFPSILQEVPHAILLIIGSGPDLPLIKKMALEKGLNDSIIWFNRLQHKELFSYYKLMDVVVVPSLLEGFGLVAAEASATGKPVVASDIDGLREVVANGISGLLVTPNSSKAFADAVLSILKNEKTASRFGENGRKRANDLFSYSRFAEKVKSTYGEAG